MKVFIRIFLLLMLGFIYSSTLYAGFPVGKKRMMLSPTYNFYQSKAYWDRNSQLIPNPNNGRFASHYVGIFGAVGVGERTDLVFNLPFVYQVFRETGLTNTNSTIGDATIGMSFLINDFDQYKFLTFTPSVIIPLYARPTTPQPIPGLGLFGLEGKLGFSGSTRTRLNNQYWDMNVGLRRFIDTAGPSQIFADALWGIPIDESWTTTLSLSGLRSFSSVKGFLPSNPFVNRDFAFIRAQLGLGRKIQEGIEVFGTIYSDLWGMNVGKGSGGAITLVFKFGLR